MVPSLPLVSFVRNAQPELAISTTAATRSDVFMLTPWVIVRTLERLALPEGTTHAHRRNPAPRKHLDHCWTISLPPLAHWLLALCSSSHKMEPPGITLRLSRPTSDCWLDGTELSEIDECLRASRTEADWLPHGYPRSANDPQKKIPRNATRYRGSLYLRAGDRTRTGDVQLGKLAFYQLNYARRHGRPSDRTTSEATPPSRAG